MGLKFLNLGKQPLANGFLTQKEFDNEFFFDLQIGFDPYTYLVSLINFVKPEKMFNDKYAYTSSCSNTMKQHFKSIAEKIKIIQSHNPDFKILEIGSNDGIFIRRFNQNQAIAVEPCLNFANITNTNGYKTYNNFWTMDLSEQIKRENGEFDVVYSANCMCHIQDIQQAFYAVNNILKPNGIFIFEDPSLLNVIQNNSYDQFYDEHAHIFSIIALKKLLEQSELYIYDIEHLKTHGGSNRIYTSKHNINPTIKVKNTIDLEYGYRLHKLQTYDLFANRVNKSKKELKELIQYINNRGEKIVGYGATSKSTVVYNYCEIEPENIDYIMDTTESKQGKFSPGTHIPIIPPQKIDYEYVFLGAWNYIDEILIKEKNRDFKIITHVPNVKII